VPVAQETNKFVINIVKKALIFLLSY